jgi:ribosome-binding factor A
MSSPRVRKIADRIQVIVAEMLERRIKDPRLGFVTITDVRVSGDSQQATIFYTVLGAAEDQEAQMASSAAALESAKGLLRSEVGKQLGMRHVPTLTFVADALPDTARHLEEVLARAKAQDEAVAAARGAAYAGEEDPYKKPRVRDEDDPEDDPEDGPEDDPEDDGR